MSDYFSPLNDLKFKDNIKVAENPAFTNKSAVNETEVAISIQFTYRFLKQLNETADKYSFSYVEILNSQIDFVQFIESERLNKRLRFLSYKILAEIGSVKGRQRINLLSKCTVVSIFKSELLDVRCYEIKLCKLDEKKIELEKKCRVLSEKLSKENEMANIISEQNLDIYALQEKNSYLANYIQKLESQLPNVQTEKDIDIDTLKPKTRQRTLKKLETEAQRALWFAETFGLTPKSLTMTSKKGENISIRLQEKEKSDVSHFTSMSEEDKEKIKKLVFLLDRFCISDAAYHEFTMIHDDLPRSYLLIQCKNELNKMVEIERLPGNVPGAMINLNSEIEKLLERHTVKHSDVNDIKIKFSGDGTKVSRISNFVIFSISNMSINGSLSFQEQHTFAIVECSETYDNLKKCCKPIFDQFNSVLSKRKWHIGEKTLNVEYFVSADMKFIQLLLGLCGATGEYACPWCKVNKEGRSDLTRPWDYYHNPSIGRNIEDMLDSNFKKSYGCKHMPLISLPVNHYVPDELHLMLRITDVLLRNLIDDALEMDDDSKMRRIIPINLKKLTELLQSCGVSFHMWHNKAGEIEWTSLSGTEKVKLLNHLPSKLASEDGVIFENSKHSVIKLWEDFYVLYKYVNDTTDSGEVIFEKAKLWLENFLNIGKLCRKGYNLHNVTPYMHCLVYHVPFFASHFGPLKMFSGQGLEKNNDIVKQIHQKKSNKWDSAVSALVTRKRLEFGHTNNLEREKRAYEKSSNWWTNDLKNSRSVKRRLILEEISEADIYNKSSVDFTNMTDHELKLYLKSNGVNTKLRKREKLLSLILSLNV